LEKQWKNALSLRELPAPELIINVSEKFIPAGQ
jgi:hypothetical protein